MSSKLSTQGSPRRLSRADAAELTDKALRRGAFHSVPDLIAAIEDYLAAHNDEPRPLVWAATAESILEKVPRDHVALQAVKQNRDTPVAFRFPAFQFRPDDGFKQLLLTACQCLPIP